MSLSRIINKTPLVNEKSNVYELTEINSQVINKIIQSRFISEGVFGIEQYSIDDYKEQYLFSPSFEKYPLPPYQKEWKFDLKEVMIFELILDKPNFQPLDINNFVDLFNLELHSSVFIQCLICKRTDASWRENAINSYKSYLNGNDFPLENKFTLRLQDKVLNVLTKIGNFSTKRDRIDEMESKILSDNFRFEIRILLFDDNNVDKTISELQKTLQKLTFFNEIKVKTVKNKKNMLNLIANREFQGHLVNQMLSEQEIYSLLSNNKPTTVQKVELPNPVKQQSITKSLEGSMLLQRVTQFMPRGENRNVEIDDSKAQQINQAFKRVGIVQKPLKINEIHQCSTLMKVQMVIPSNVTYSAFTKKLTDIKSALGNENISIEISDKPDTINIFLPLENRGVVYFRDILESEQFQSWCKNIPLPFIIGENVNGELMFGNLEELRHLLVTGATGSGKSVFVNLMLLCLLLNVPPNELAMYLIDPKQVEYSMFNGFPQVKKIVTDMNEANKLLESIVVEMENRYALFAKSGVKNISSYNKNNDQKIPYIIVAVDEYADLVMVNPNVEEHLVRLGQKARAAGIHLIICTQKPLADIVTSVLKSNLPSAISFRLKTSQDYLTVFGKGIPYNLLGKGDGVCKLDGQLKEYERFQSPILTLVEEDEDNIYTELKNLFKDVQLQNNELPVAETDIDKLKRIIATTGELRVSELQSQMGIAIGKVSDLLKQLVDEEWLRKEGRSYVINVSHDELVKWGSGT
ncbi:FtsK/SpoIIIE domain-containing protein [Bacillus xiapuensis]|uniref:FtsK/SpoIIIE domain-containing protein n=1 Tax=Bacillus xiapuensis TaxID=2014075 RepID=A0ABU6NAJ1_9BACI|nr:FtsK/SpoIIIE domain-containing protein [Bacillus xiapuensis]